MLKVVQVTSQHIGDSARLTGHRYRSGTALQIPAYTYHVCLSQILSSTFTAVILELVAQFTREKIARLFPSYKLDPNCCY